MSFITNLRRGFLTFTDSHSVDGCYRYFFWLRRFEAFRFRMGCEHMKIYNDVRLNGGIKAGVVQIYMSGNLYNQGL